MPAMSSGTVARPRTYSKPKSGTASSRKHRFETFSQRVAKIKVEPVRRGRETVVHDDELDANFSYFRNALDEWREQNMAETFTTFARQVAPLCESLPQLLHHSTRVLDLLLANIEKADIWSEEPLLALAAHFAHDLGVKFEPYFERVVGTVAKLAASNPAVEVIEWSFSCLAWLLKYLSRVLVPDLRPTFDLMAPLLGKERQKAFVSNFAAESLSFLVRKAGAIYHRDRKPLELIMGHISVQLSELQGSGKDADFQRGLMALFSDSMKGIQRGLHSSATAILTEMLHQTFSDDYKRLQTRPLEPVLLGTVISIIHHSDAENFDPLSMTLLEYIKARSSDSDHLALSSRLVYTICGVRKGTRIRSWSSILETLKLLLDCGNKGDHQITASERQDFLAALAVVFQYCPMEAAIPYVQMLEAVSQGAWEPYFLSFCNSFLSPDRFKTLVLPYFKRFVSYKAESYGPEICTVLPELRKSEALPTSSIQPSSRWQGDIAQRFAKLAELGLSNPGLSFECNAYLNALRTFNLENTVKEGILGNLNTLLERALEIIAPEDVQPMHIFAMSGFKFLVTDGQDMESFWPSLVKAAPIYVHYPAYWQAILIFLEQNKRPALIEEINQEAFRNALMLCLRSPSHDLRLTALGILELAAGNSEENASIVATARMIEDTPLTLETARSVSMRIRQLSKSYPSVQRDSWLNEAIPSFCFGLLYVRFAQTWDDSCVALKEMCETKDGEQHISRISFQWLDSPDVYESPAVEEDTQGAPIPRYASHFECTNLMHLERRRSRNEAASVDKQLKSMFYDQHVRVSFIVASSRTQSLRLLNTIPLVAEKRSRSLVPTLLKWGLQDESDADLDSQQDGQQQWSRNDQKTLLTLFSKFVNPKVLFRSEDVYSSLLVLLGNGDVEIQKAALKAILTWKNTAITKYQENLSNLLDDARFREEISVFMDVSKEDSQLQTEHRQELLPVILRILYGKIVSGKRGQDAKRKAVFIALTRFEQDAVQQFVDIAFGPLSGLSLIVNDQLDNSLFEKELIPLRKQVGLLNMLEDLLKTLKTTMTPFIGSIVDPLLYCLINASRGLSTAIPAVSETEEDTEKGHQTSLLRTIRQRGLHSLNILFESCPEYAWSKYVPAIVHELVNPRLQQLPTETAQSVSGILRLFAAWAKSPLTASYFVNYDSDILSRVVECLAVPAAKDEVLQFVLDQIIRSLIGLTSDGESAGIQSDILQRYANLILSRVGDLLKKSPSKDVLESAVHTIAELAPHISGSTESRDLIEISTFLLRQPTKRVGNHTKMGLLQILHQFIPRCAGCDLDSIFDDIFDVTSGQFSYVQDRVARTVLCNIVQVLSDHHKELEITAKLCWDLNSFSINRLDEPDFERRQSAFTTINKTLQSTLTLTQWKPIVSNMLFYIKDGDELIIRDSASLSLRRFIDASVQAQETGSQQSYKGFISSTVLPGIQNGVRFENSELVRTEFLNVLAHLVSNYPQWPPVSDLHVLLGADDESSFFGNVLHIQGHRRLRALRKLAASAPQLASGNIAHLLLPLIEHFIFNKAEDDQANNLAGEAVKTVAALAEWLEWPQFRSLFKRYSGYLSSKEDMQKTLVKLLAGLMQSLNHAGRAKGYVTVKIEDDTLDSLDEPAEDEMDVDTPPTDNIPQTMLDEQTVSVSTTTPSKLTQTLPQQDKLTADLCGNLLPSLTEYLHNKDDATVSLRVPMAIAVVKILLVLPQLELENRLPAVLLDICHILKSRSQDSRDMARNTLSEIALLVGPSYLQFILRGMRTALQRGYQLHVLSYCMHHILVKMTNQLKPGDLDYCLTEIVDIIMDDIFGVPGEEKNAEEYISKMKEVKSSKSFDSLDIISRSTTPAHLVDLVSPVQGLLCEKIGVKAVQKIDEVLRRLGLGILQNSNVKNQDILVWCYELIQDVYKTTAKSTEAKPDQETKSQSQMKRLEINMKGAAKSGARGSASSYIYKISRFSLDVLRTVVKKYPELQTPSNMAGFLPIVGDAIIQGNEEVQIAAIRFITAIIKTPMEALDRDCPVYVAEAVRVIKGETSSHTELAQASLKMIAAILKERREVEIKERDLAFLITRLIPDLDEANQQGLAFGFVRAVMNRKILMPEVYSLMDRVATMMVTNQTRSARDLARSNYFYFLMEYPQAKNRFSKQLEFLIRNLRYDYVEGRQSVMEALNLILTKIGDGILQDCLGVMFIPLIHTMANDDSTECRTMAGALLKKVFERADTQKTKGFLSDLRSWLEQDEDTGLKRLGIQVWGLYFEATESKPNDVEFVLAQLQSTVEDSLERRDEDDWELIYYSLTVFQKLCKVSPGLTFSSEDFWASIQSCVSYPHAWVKLTAAKLMGTFFADVGITNKDRGLGEVPLTGSHGIQLTSVDMIQLANAFLRNLAVPGVTEELCAQSIRNLVFLGRCFAVNNIEWNWAKVDDDDEVEPMQEATNGDATNDGEDEFGGFSPQPVASPSPKSVSQTAIHRLMTRLSALIRRETKIMRLPSLYPKTAVIALLETLVSNLPIPPLLSSLPHLLTTLSTLSSPQTPIPRSTDTAFNEAYKALIDKSREVMRVLQKRMDGEEYLAMVGEVQRGIRDRREERRTKRKLEAVTMPEKIARDKKRKHDATRNKRKERGVESRGQRRGW